MEAFVEHLSSSGPATDVVVADVRADILVRQADVADAAIEVWSSAPGAVRLVQRAGSVIARGVSIGAHASPPALVVTIPRGASLAVRRVQGAVTIEDLDGGLTLDLHGPVNVDAQRVATAHISLQGHGGRICVAKVDGRSLGIDVFGTGRVRAAGEVERLRARVVGAGDVDFGGEAQIADLCIDGPGYINVLRVRRQLRRWCVGAGEARVTHRPAPSVSPVAVTQPVAVGLDGA